MTIPTFAARRVIAGGLIGLIVFAVDAVATLIRFAFHPSLAERATLGSFLAMVLFLFLFFAAGALAGYLWGIRVQLLRVVSIGALVGALVWSYLTITWPLTARPTAMTPPKMSVPRAVLLGAGGGALGGLLLLVIDSVRTRLHRDRSRFF